MTRLRALSILAASVLVLPPSASRLRAQSPPPAPAGNRVISGNVIGGASGQPLAQAEVTLQIAGGGKLVAETITAPDGHFLFAQLPDGRYRLSASHRGYVSSAYQEHDFAATAIVTGPGLDTTGLQLTLPPDAAIYGTVTEDSGDPVPQARISLFAPARRGATGRITRAGSAIADAMGNFDLPHLAPGLYYLCASGNPWYAAPQGIFDIHLPSSQAPSPLDLAYRTACYPDGTDPAGAAPLTVNPGDRLPINLVLHPVPAVHLTFQVPAPGSGRGFVAPQLRQNLFGIPEFVQSGFSVGYNTDPQDPNATMTMQVSVAPGQYELQLTSAGASGDTEHYTTIDASSGSVSLDASSLSALSAVSGKVVLPGGGSPPAGLVIVLLPDQGDTYSQSAQIASDGSFHLDGVRPGTYEVLFAGTGSDSLAVTGLSAKGAFAQGRILQVGSAPITLTALAAPANASIYGFTQIAGKPAPGVFVLLVPADPYAGRHAWLPNQSDSDGSFYFPHVPPGAYSLVAIQQGWTLDWAHPEVIARYFGKAVNLTVTPTSTQINLKTPLEAQPK
jgi:Carboxypeptidase regulatory-like domain